jgi:hypothetical protein
MSYADCHFRGPDGRATCCDQSALPQNSPTSELDWTLPATRLSDALRLPLGALAGYLSDNHRGTQVRTRPCPRICPNLGKYDPSQPHLT